MWYVPHYIHIQYTEFVQMTPNTKPDRARDCSSAICLGNRIRAKIFLRTYIPAHYLSLFISCPSFLEHSLRSSSILYAFIPSLTSPITVRHPISWIICANQSSCNILPYRFFFPLFAFNWFNLLAFLSTVGQWVPPLSLPNSHNRMQTSNGWCFISKDNGYFH